MKFKVDVTFKKELSFYINARDEYEAEVKAKGQFENETGISEFDGEMTTDAYDEDFESNNDYDNLGFENYE